MLLEFTDFCTCLRSCGCLRLGCSHACRRLTFTPFTYRPQTAPQIAGLGDTSTSLTTRYPSRLRVRQPPNGEGIATSTALSQHCEIEQRRNANRTPLQVAAGIYCHSADGGHTKENGHRGMCCEGGLRRCERGTQISAARIPPAHNVMSRAVAQVNPMHGPAHVGTETIRLALK